MNSLNKYTIFLIFLFFSAACSYEYYTFAQEIPGTVCKFKKCESTMMGTLGQDIMNLHGLWPDTADPAQRPSNCDQNLYDEDQIDPTIKGKMDKEWVGLYNNTFWFRYHEWGKHGTCWQDDSTYEHK